MKKLGLVLEGGGMRGAYTAGVLDWLLENEIYFDYVVGISSGALYATMYAQKDRNALREASIEIASDKRNVGMKAIMAEKTIVGYNFLFDQIKNKSKFDLTKQDDTEIKVEIGVYDINEQETIWVNSEEIAKHPKMVQAACTLPIFGRAVKIDGKPYMDGGVTTMIPIERSLEAGCEMHMVVTTKSDEFIRKPQGFVQRNLLRQVYRKSPKLVSDFESRTDVYYEERAQIEKLEQEGKALYMYPSKELGVSRFKGDKEQFQGLFDTARRDCEVRKEAIFNFYKTAKKKK